MTKTNTNDNRSLQTVPMTATKIVDEKVEAEMAARDRHQDLTPVGTADLELVDYRRLTAKLRHDALLVSLKRQLMARVARAQARIAKAEMTITFSLQRVKELEAEMTLDHYAKAPAPR